LLRERLVTESELQAAVDDLTRFTHDPRTIIGAPRVFQLWGHRKRFGRDVIRLGLPACTIPGHPGDLLPRIPDESRGDGPATFAMTRRASEGAA
jgi:hypothetical protein